jgi:hypothetical protein
MLFLRWRLTPNVSNVKVRIERLKKLIILLEAHLKKAKIFGGCA